MKERAACGYFAGGRSFGYSSEPVDASDPKTKYVKVFDPDQAQVVVRVFEMYASGMSPRRIAAQLNNEGVPSPGASWSRQQRRKKGWVQSAIAGDAKHGIGILNNELYVGRMVWNRSLDVADEARHE